jgi:hypothetical protein
LRRRGIDVPLLGLGRNFLVHGQSTNARSELQLLNIPIQSPGWRKAHVVRSYKIFDMRGWTGENFI